MPPRAVSIDANGQTTANRSLTRGRVPSPQWPSMDSAQTTAFEHNRHGRRGTEPSKSRGAFNGIQKSVE